MRSLFVTVFCAALLCLLLPGVTRANIVFDSQAGLALTQHVCNSGVASASTLKAPPCPNNLVSNTSVQIDTNAAWQQTIPGDPNAVWISNWDSGQGDTQFQYRNDTSAIFTISKTFNVSGPTQNISIKVWADDTAKVILDSTVIWQPFLGSNNICASGVVGCLPIYGGIYTGGISPGQHTLTFEPWQQGTEKNTTGNPFGIIFSASVPDGGLTLMLLGSALVGLETLRRKLRA